MQFHSVIVFKKNGQPAYAAVKWTHFLNLIAPLVEEEQKAVSTEIELLVAKLSDLAARVKAAESCQAL